MRLFLLGAILLLSACGASGESSATAQPPRAERITCHAAYRASVEQGIEREETLTFADEEAEQSVAFADQTFHAAYRSGEMDNERALRLWVTAGAPETVYQSQLYQLPSDSGPQNQFVGGHGFTGLNYSYHPASGSEMQFWCAVETGE